MPDRQRRTTVRERNVGHAGGVSGRGRRHHGADDVENAAGIADRRFDGNAGQNAPIDACDDNVPAGSDGPGRNEARQQQLESFE